MSVLALITDSAEARAVIAAAYHCSRAFESDLSVLCYEYSPIAEEAIDVSRQDVERQGLVVHVLMVIEELNSQLADGETPAGSVAVWLTRHPDALTATIEQTRRQDIELVVASAQSAGANRGVQSLQARLLRHAPSHLSLVSLSEQPAFPPKRLLAVATDSADDRSLVAGALQLALACEGELTVAVLEDEHGRQAQELGERELESVLKGAGVVKSDQVKTLVLETDHLVTGINPILDQYDVVTLGSKNFDQLPQLIDSTSRATASRTTISVFRKSAPIRPWKSNRRIVNFVPALSPADYADLVQNLRKGSRWNSDFRIMLGLAVGIASLGLLLNSSAVIIGSMLLAPLMTPMVGAGLALVQGNARLARTCIGTISLGILLALLVSFLLGLALPGDELTSEMTGRGSPNLIDLLIALLSAAAGAYALARPTLAGSVAGVAIATALVPPLCTVGISLADQRFDIAAGALMLFVTNFLAIVLAAAGMFRWMGLGESVDPIRKGFWVRLALFVMLSATMGLSFPLSQGLISRLRKGVSQDPAAPLSQPTYDAIQAYIDQVAGVSLVFGVRRPSTLERTADYRIVVASESPVPRSLSNDIVNIVRKLMADETLRVEVIAVQQNWATEKSSRQAD